MRFAPQPDFAAVLPSLAKKMVRVERFSQWSSNVQRFDFLSGDNKTQFAIDHTSATFTTRTLDEWHVWTKQIGEMMTDVLDAYGVSEATSCSFLRDSLVDIGMTYKEMADLGRESLLKPSLAIMEDSNDWSLALVEDRESTFTRVDIGPMNREMATKQFQSAANVTRLTEPAWGPGLGSLLDEIDGDRLWLRYDLVKKKVSKHGVKRLMNEFETKGERLVEQSVKKLTNLI
ncbi:hypothetical protein [Stieleria tagensis]|uniref:hypothetical protein n=1 Tax=Stieleria tagensis TaxID=2956795 RepID=UPI00209B7E41|nr:hypothetical protein [Stieleria tagensis]